MRFSLFSASFAALLALSCSARDGARDAGADEAARADEAGPETDPDAGEPEPTEPVCGNWTVEGAEECDDGRNGLAGDGCRDDCTFTCHEATQAVECDDGHACTQDICHASLHTCLSVLVARGTQCRDPAGACDAPERCTGADEDCPSDVHAAPDVVCRASAGVCDAPEKCTGASADCPADALRPSGAPCRAAAGDCDLPENCPGSSPLCPADAVKSSATVCRPSAGDCDLLESCTGSDPLCPADARRGTDDVCRPSSGLCDVAERCTGTGTACPANAFLPTSVVCRAQSGQCDAVERCSGTAAICPYELFQPQGTPCDDAVYCTLPDRCTVDGRCDGPAAPGLWGVARVAAGETFTCALLSTGNVKCWGNNASGQLGDGTVARRTSPTDLLGLTGGIALAAPGQGHACALLSSGAARCWGANASGQLGDGTTNDRLTPVPVAGLSAGVTAIAAGGGHTCALLSTGAARCWGANASGQLGDGTFTGRATPAPVAGLPAARAVDASMDHTCAVTAAGSLLCWGWNSYGQLGDGTTDDRPSPSGVGLPASGVAAASAGGYHTCALTTAGGLLCWGWNAYGQLGDGTTDDRLTPVAVAGITSGAASLSAGGGHTCALLSSGAVRCWGDNRFGQLGDGTTASSATPVAAAGLTASPVAIEAGSDHTCALLPDGAVRCWGWNYYGQLGDGTTTSSATPVTTVCR